MIYMGKLINEFYTNFFHVFLPLDLDWVMNKGLQHNLETS